MTAKASISKNKLFSMKYFKHTFRSYWWLAVIAAIIYAIAGPLILWMAAANTRKYAILRADNDLKEEIVRLVQQWFGLNGVMSYYIIAMFLAVVFALVTWSYLHSKKQINFYHAQPISRESLFLNNILVGIAINIGPMLAMYALSLLIGIGYGGLSSVPWQIALVHPVRIFLFFMLSYSLAVLAAQLTGTVLTQFGMSAVLHFGLMSFLLVAVLALQTFLDTFDGSAAFGRIWYLSPLSNCIYWFTEPGMSFDTAGNIYLPGLGVKWILWMVAITAVAFITAFIAYKKRASESAGTPLIFSFTKPIIEFLLMFCVATLAGIAFLEVSGKFFFVVGVVLFAVLTHMFCQVVYSKDFKAMFANKKYLLGFVAALLLFFGAMYTDLFGYDSYVPRSDKVSAIQIDLRSIDNRSTRYALNTSDGNIYTDANDIELLLAIADQVTESEHYYRNSNLYNNDYLNDITYQNTMTLRYTYITSSGRKINREYNQVPIEEFKQDFLALYNQSSFKRNVYAQILNLQVGDVCGYDLRNIIYSDFIRNSGADVDDTLNYGYSSGYGYSDGKYTAELLDAMKLDAMQRSSDDFPMMPLYALDMQIFDEANKENGNRVYTWVVYSADKNTIAIIDKMAAEYNFAAVDYTALADYISYLDIYEANSDSHNDVENFLDSYYAKTDVQYLSDEGFTKTRTVTNKAEIADILAHTLSNEAYYSSSPLISIRDDIFIGVHMRDIIDSNCLWDLNLIVPEGTDI